jgi:hypothetical protein
VPLEKLYGLNLCLVDLGIVNPLCLKVLFRNVFGLFRQDYLLGLFVLADFFVVIVVVLILENFLLNKGNESSRLGFVQQEHCWQGTFTKLKQSLKQRFDLCQKVGV